MSFSQRIIMNSIKNKVAFWGRSLKNLPFIYAVSVDEELVLSIDCRSFLEECSWMNCNCLQCLHLRTQEKLWCPLARAQAGKLQDLFSVLFCHWLALSCWSSYFTHAYFWFPCHSFAFSVKGKALTVLGTMRDPMQDHVFKCPCYVNNMLLFSYG